MEHHDKPSQELEEMTTSHPTASGVTGAGIRKETMAYGYGTGGRLDAEGVASTRVFNNYVILEHILQFLDHGDVKALTAVSRQMITTVRRCPMFQNRSRLCFLAENQTRRPPLMPSSVDPTDFPWKSVAVELTCDAIDNGRFAELPRLLPNVISLELSSATPRDFYTDGCVLQMLKMVSTLLGATEQLQQLIITVDLLDLNSNYSILTQNLKLQESLKQLDSLQIGGSSIPKGVSKSKGKVTLKGRKGFKLSLGCVAFLGLVPQRLTKFGFDGIGLPKLEKGKNNCPFVSTLISILKKHKQTLTSVRMAGFIFRSKDIETMTFPSLNHLCIAGLEFPHLVQAGNFLVNQPPLQTLELKFCASDAGRRFMEIPILKHTQTLKEFNFSWTKDAALADVFDYGNWDDWSIRLVKMAVEHQKMLEPIQLRPDSSVYTFEFMKKFEKLNKVKVHHCNNVADMDGFMRGPIRNSRWRRWRNATRTPPDSLFSVLPVGVREIVIGGKRAEILGGNDYPFVSQLELGRLSDVSVLNLVDCPGVIGDDILRFICREMRQLREFGFSHCEYLNDLGIAGARAGHAAFPCLLDLTNLRKLHIVACRYLTSQGMLRAISLPLLQELTLNVPAGPMMLDFFVSIVTQNQNLQLLRIANYKGTVVPEYQNFVDQLKGASPRFVTLEVTPKDTSKGWTIHDENRFVGRGRPPRQQRIRNDNSDWQMWRLDSSDDDTDSDEDYFDRGCFI